MTRLHLNLLGGFEARPESGSSLTFRTQKAQALLAYLAVPPARRTAATSWRLCCGERCATSRRERACGRLSTTSGRISATPLELCGLRETRCCLILPRWTSMS